MLTSIMRYSDPFMMLKASTYRREIKLNDLERNIVLKEGFIRLAESSLASIDSLNDPHHCHRDTPHHGVVPKAQHATATCCRKCLFNWHRIPRYRELNEHEKAYVLHLILRWVKKETYARQNIGVVIENGDV